MEPVDAVRVFVVSVLGFLFFFLKNLLPILVLVLVVEGRAGGGRKKFIAVADDVNVVLVFQVLKSF